MKLINIAKGIIKKLINIAKGIVNKLINITKSITNKLINIAKDIINMLNHHWPIGYPLLSNFKSFSGSCETFKIAFPY